MATKNEDTRSIEARINKDNPCKIPGRMAKGEWANCKRWTSYGTLQSRSNAQNSGLGPLSNVNDSNGYRILPSPMENRHRCYAPEGAGGVFFGQTTYNCALWSRFQSRKQKARQRRYDACSQPSTNRRWTIQQTRQKCPRQRPKQETSLRLFPTSKTTIWDVCMRPEVLLW